MNHEAYMQEALKEAKLSFEQGNAPFAVIVVDQSGNIVWRDHDRVREQMDPTAHGEVNAVRQLCKKLQILSLAGYTFYTTSEPCPTCLSTMIKAEVSACYYGAKTEPTASLPIPAELLASYAEKYPIKVVGGILAEECLKQRKMSQNGG